MNREPCIKTRSRATTRVPRLLSPYLLASIMLFAAGGAPAQPTETTAAPETTPETTEPVATEMVSYHIEDFAIPTSLTGKPGDPAKGRALVIRRDKGNCLACHRMPIPEEPDHGTTGPDLTHVASRASVPMLRLRVVNPKRFNPQTMMPAFYRVDGLHRVAKKFQGRPIMTAGEVEDVVAYLATLK